MEVFRTPQHKSKAASTLVVVSAACMFFADWLKDDAVSWCYWLTAGELGKAMLCGALALVCPRNVRPYALSGGVWYVGQAVVELFSYVGPMGYSAHGPWEVVAFAVLFGSTYLIQRA